MMKNKLIDFKNKSILITGGTGSLGKAIITHLTTKFYNIKKIIIFSRDEQKQFQMGFEFSKDDYPFIDYVIGDVRDLESLKRSFTGIDFVIHAAAMKHVHIAENNPTECINTNVNGAKNVIQAAIEQRVSNVVALSTDKACAPVNLYGATKLTSDKLFVAANNLSFNSDCVFSVVRYGNVMGSNGSVIPFFLKMKKAKNELPITHKEMTRFNIPILGGVEMVFHALYNAWGGEIFIPKIPSYRILDVAKAIGPKCDTPIVGIRPGEKIHEEMITPSDSYNTYDLGKYYTILPSISKWSLKKFIKEFNAKKVQSGFSYNSGTNDKWETVDSLRDLIKQHIDPNFSV